MKRIRITLDRFDRIVLVVLALLGLTVGGLTLAINLRGVVVVTTIPVDSGVVSAYGQIGIEFSQDMQVESTQAAFSLEPETPGKFRWGDKALWFIPQQPLKPGLTYQARLGTTAISRDGRHLRKEITWQFTVRQPDVIYLKLESEETGEIWSQRVEGGEERQLTQAEGKVSSFGISADGEWIAYSASNPTGGVDLWVADRQGKQPRLLVACEKAWCSSPSWSPDGKRIAYSQQGTGSAGGLPRIWTVEVANGNTAPLYTDSSVTGTDPTWSPDGTHLAFYDLGIGGIRVLDLKSSQESIMKTSLQQSGSWSPDSRQILFSLPEIINQILVVSVYQIDLENGEVVPALSRDNQGQIDYGLPAWSPDGEWIAVSTRLAGTTESRQIVLEHLDGSDPQQITQTPVYNYAAYHWDPWGKALVFQRFPQGQSGGEPEVGVWDGETGKITVLAKNAALPQWMP